VRGKSRSQWAMHRSHTCITRFRYGVATFSRLLEIIYHFCKRALLKRRYSAQETYNFKETTNRSHAIRPNADREAQNLEIISKNIVPGVPGFSWDLWLVACDYLVLIVNNSLGRIDHRPPMHNLIQVPDFIIMWR